MTGRHEPDLPEDPVEAEALRRARRLFATEPVFLGSTPSMASLPLAEHPEIAFVGRSNVGKSSLINALVGRKDLARTSNTPGRTRMLNFFRLGPMVLVDLPGYGHAEAPKAEIKAWTRLIEDYLRGRVVLRRVNLLIDSRHGPKSGDETAMDLLDQAGVPYALVMTKADKVKPAEGERAHAACLTAIATRAAAQPEIHVTSSETGAGLDALRLEIFERLLDLGTPGL